MQFLAGAASDLAPDVMAGIARYRHKVFVETLGWDLVCERGFELDQFDRADTQYVVAHDPAGDPVGVARLLPTTRPYLLSEVFPTLMGDALAPRSADVWELSRFAAIDFKSGASNGQFSSSVAIDLLCAAQACAAKSHAKHLITVSPLGVERLLRKAGFRSHRAGPPKVLGGHSLFACWIELPPIDPLSGKRRAVGADHLSQRQVPAGHPST